ncbi:MAG: D-alanine--D-alanine ligase [Betaproteobacteria bacterium]|nr:D-alanine--D-alanine ligase [Betaproteobacteria bacterium]
MTDFGRVAVLMGGSSAEREISLISGRAVLKALCGQGVNAHAFDPSEQPIWDLKQQGYDRVFTILHGRRGEDGVVQGALELLGVPYTGSGVMASALAMDKWRTKLVWQAAGIPTPRYCLLTPGGDWKRVADKLGLPLIVKPVREGSSIGLTKVNAIEEMAAAFELAYRLDPLVIAEEFVTGQELTAAVLGEEVLPLVRIEAPEGKYDYNNKYFTDAVQYHCPAGVDPEITAKINETVLQAFRVLGCTGWGRADLILRADGSFSLLEMNTLPGMTGHSLVPMAARVAGISFEQLVIRILERAQLG